MSARLAHNTLRSSEFTPWLCSSTEKRAEVTPPLMDPTGGEAMLFTERFNITLDEILLQLLGKLYFKLTNIIIEIEFFLRQEGIIFFFFLCDSPSGHWAELKA